MPYIRQLDYEHATPSQQAAQDAELALRGRMTNMKRTLLHSPVALKIYGEWFSLRDELLPIIGPRAVWLLAHAICVAAQCEIGIGFMRRALIEGGDNPDALECTEAEHDLVALGQALGANPKTVPPLLWTRLQQRYSEKTLVDLIAFGGLMVATNLFNDAVQVSRDSELNPFLAPHV